MRTLLIIFGFFFMAQDGSAQTKIWSQDFSIVTIKNNEARHTMIYFSGSDWCKPCIKMKKDILETTEFLNYASVFSLYQADFPYRKKLAKEHKKFNETLAEMYNPEGIFPCIVVVDSKGKVVFKSGYKNVETKVFINLIKNAMNY